MLLRAASPLGKERRGPTFSSASRREKARQGEEIAGKDVGGGVGKEESSQFLFFLGMTNWSGGDVQIDGCSMWGLHAALTVVNRETRDCEYRRERNL
jgi:hypothetical protein